MATKVTQKKTKLLRQSYCQQLKVTTNFIINLAKQNLADNLKLALSLKCLACKKIDGSTEGAFCPNIFEKNHSVEEADYEVDSNDSQRDKFLSILGPVLRSIKNIWKKQKTQKKHHSEHTCLGLKFKVSWVVSALNSVTLSLHVSLNVLGKKTRLGFHPNK